MASPYQNYMRLQRRPNVPWTPYGQSNLPMLTGSGSLQAQAAQVGDLASYQLPQQSYGAPGFGLGQGSAATSWQQPPAYNPNVIGGGAGLPMTTSSGAGAGGGAAGTSSAPGWLPLAGFGMKALGMGYNYLHPPNYKFSRPGTPPQLAAMRRNMGNQAQAKLGQRREGIRRVASRVGLTSSPGFMSSLENPAWMEYGQDVTAGEAAISKMELDAWLATEQMRLQQEYAQLIMEGQQMGFGDLLMGLGDLGISFADSRKKGGGGGGGG